MDVAEKLVQTEQEIERLADDVLLLEKAWRNHIPPVPALAAAIDNYLVPYYKAKGTQQVLKLFQRGNLDMAKLKDVRVALEDLKAMENRRALIVHQFQQILPNLELDAEELMKEIRYRIKPFYELVGGRDMLQSLLDSANDAGENAAGG